MRRAVLVVTAILVAAVTTGCGGSDSTSDSAASGNPTPGDSGITRATQDTTGRWQLVVARVGDEEITVEDAYFDMLDAVGPDRAAQTVLNPDMLQVALAALMDQFAWAQKARNDGFELLVSEKSKLRTMETRFLATRYLGDVVQYLADPSDEIVTRFYMENQQNYLLPGRVATAHIVVATEGEAQALLAQLRNGADFRGLAREYSLDDLTRDIGGNQGWVEPGSQILGVGRNDVFENAVLPLSVGEFAIAPVAGRWHVVTVLKREEGRLQPLEDVREDITLAMRRANWGAAYNDALDRARDETGARFVPEAITQFTGIEQNVERVFDMAAKSNDPGQRIELYRRIVFDFPDHPLAPECQFMIAYLNLKWINDHTAAKKALNRMERRWPESEWNEAGKWLDAHYLDPDAPEHYGHAHADDGSHELEARVFESPQEILTKSKE